VTPELPAIQQWCEAEGLWLFEDCAHAHGSEWNGKRAGGFGIAGAYSFFATKVITSAEGGMIVTDDDELAHLARLYRNHGKPEPWVSYHTHVAANGRASELNAAVGLTHLRRLDEFIEWRQRVADRYTELLQDTGLALVLPQDRSSWYKYIVLLPERVDRSAVKRRAKEQGVSLSGEVYEIPLHRQPALEPFGDVGFPIADEICRRHICLPLYYGMTEEEATFVVSTLRNTLEEIMR
jgi:perosamine synthetase